MALNINISYLTAINELVIIISKCWIETKTKWHVFCCAVLSLSICPATRFVQSSRAVWRGFTEEDLDLFWIFNYESQWSNAGPTLGSNPHVCRLRDMQSIFPFSIFDYFSLKKKNFKNFSKVKLIIIWLIQFSTIFLWKKNFSSKTFLN